MGRHRENRFVFACRMGVDQRPQPQPRPCGGGAWGWLLFVGLIFGLPWFWACDGKSSSTNRKVTFKLERPNLEALDQIKKNLEELKSKGKMSAAAVEAELEKTLERLKGNSEENGPAEPPEGVAVVEDGPRTATPVDLPRPPQPPRPLRNNSITGRTLVVKGSGSRGSAVPAWDVQLEPNDGYGYTDNAERAKEKVIDKAADVIAQWIREHGHPYSDFKPDLTFLKKEGIIKAGPEAEPVKVGDLDAWTANVHIALTESSQAELKERGARAENNYRLEQAWDRQQLGLKVLGGIGAFLAACVAFFHLDDRTRGYYSKPLALGLFAGAAGLGLFLLRV